MPQRKIDDYKQHYNCSHDGEALLMAADMDFFPEGPHNAPFQALEGGGFTNHPSTRTLFEAWGIEIESNRDEIVNCLSMLEANELTEEERKIIDAAIRFTTQVIN